jgi:hypothetical protein
VREHALQGRRSTRCKGGDPRSNAVPIQRWCVLFAWGGGDSGGGIFTHGILSTVRRFAKSTINIIFQSTDKFFTQLATDYYINDSDCEGIGCWLIEKRFGSQITMMSLILGTVFWGRGTPKAKVGEAWEPCGLWQLTLGLRREVQKHVTAVARRAAPQMPSAGTLPLRSPARRGGQKHATEVAPRAAAQLRSAGILPLTSPARPRKAEPSLYLHTALPFRGAFAWA